MDFQTWDRLVTHLMTGALLPIVGAGVSFGATHPGPRPVSPETPCMERALRGRVKGEQDDGMANLAERARWRGLQPAQVLRIQEFRKLRPTAAHRAMARLAREGLLPEVITTNYDCCLEEAFRATLDEGDCLAGTNDAEKKGWHPVVIRCLEEYQQRGSRRREVGGRPTWRVYKINGCAERLHMQLRDRRVGPEAYDEILLTESQLQTIRGRRTWVADLLRDRTRSRHLCLTGFGSDEPQVRFLLLEVMSEFADADPHYARHLREQGWSSANAPWVFAFRDVTFSQEQFLRSWARGHKLAYSFGSANVLDEQAAPVLERGPPCGGSGAASAPFRGRAGQRGAVDGLPADLVWTRLHQDAWGLLLKQAALPSSPVHHWLRSQGADGHWVGELLEALYPKCCKWHFHFGVTDLLEEDPEGHLPLSQWMAAVQGKTSKAGYYHALQDDPLLVVLTLVLVRVLQPHPAPEPAATASGLLLTAPPVPVVILGDRQVPSLPAEGRGALLVTVPERGHAEGPAAVATDTTDKTRKTLRAGRLLHVEAGDVLRQGQPLDMPTLVALARPLLVRQRLRRVSP